MIYEANQVSIARIASSVSLGVGINRLGQMKISPSLRPCVACINLSCFIHNCQFLWLQLVFKWSQLRDL